MTTKIIAVLLTVISTVTFANTNDSTKRDAIARVVTGSANGSYKLIYQGKEGQVKFKLLNENGRTLHDERLKIEKGFIQPVDLSHMPSGNYTFSVDNGSNKIEEEVSYVSLKDQIAGKIRFDQVADQLEFVGKDLGTELQIQIFDDNDQLVYSDAISSDNIDQIFDFHRVRSNWVSFVVLGNGKIITHQKFDLR